MFRLVAAGVCAVAVVMLVSATMLKEEPEPAPTRGGRDSGRELSERDKLLLDLPPDASSLRGAKPAKQRPDRGDGLAEMIRKSEEAKQQRHQFGPGLNESRPQPRAAEVSHASGSPDPGSADPSDVTLETIVRDKPDMSPEERDEILRRFHMRKQELLMRAESDRRDAEAKRDDARYRSELARMEAARTRAEAEARRRNAR